MKKLYITKDDLLIAQEISSHYIYGFSIFTEDLTQVKISEAKEVNDPIIKLLGDEKARLIIAKSLSENITETAKILHTSNRTVYRMLKDYDIVQTVK